MADHDGDGLCDAADRDDDDDGVLDENDICPLIWNVDLDPTIYFFVPDQDSSDYDGDGVANPCDNCRYYPSANQTDTDRDGRGNVCECTDQNGDGRNTVADLVAINLAIFNPARITPLCDGNNTGSCDVDDMLAANVEIFSPGNTSTCARQPVPGP
jgi:hypothetical protein